MKQTQMRGGKIVPVAGTWMSRCMRDGCAFVEKIFLQDGGHFPPCRRCLNQTCWWRFLHEGPPLEVPPEPAPRPMEEKAVAPTSPPAEEAHKSFIEAPIPVFDCVKLTPAKEEPCAETVAPDPVDKKNVETPAVVKPTLMQQLVGSRRKPVNAPIVRK